MTVRALPMLSAQAGSLSLHLVFSMCQAHGLGWWVCVV